MSHARPSCATAWGPLIAVPERAGGVKVQWSQGDPEISDVARWPKGKGGESGPMADDKATTHPATTTISGNPSPGFGVANSRDKHHVVHQVRPGVW